MSKAPHSAADFIVSLNMNGLEGRMMRVPAKKKHQREILLLYGHHGLLERWWGLVQNLQDYGAVTVPDLPGFGGMDSFYSIGRKPTINNYADYLAAFIKMRYGRKRITIAAISFGFVVVTRMLQKYPDIAKRVDLCVSVVGFMHRDDFRFKPFERRLYSVVAKLLAQRIPSMLVRTFWLNSFVIKHLYVRLPAGKKRFIEMEPTQFNEMIEFDTLIWRRNDMRTHWATTSEFLRLDNCQQPVAVPVWHVAAKHDHYFNNHYVEQHMRTVFTDYTQGIMNSKAHTPNLLGGKKEMAVMLPPALRKMLQRAP